MIVKYSKKFPYAPYLNEDIGFEIELDDTEGKPLPEAIQVTLGFLKEMAEKFHKDNNPQPEVGEPFTDNASHFVGVIPTQTFVANQSLPTIDPRAYETAEIGIDNATTIQDLESYADIAVKYGLVEMYLAKKKQLSQ